MRDETAELLAQSRREHGNGSLDEIDASGTLASITVEGSIGLDEVRDIGNVNADFERPVLLGFDGESVIEITSVTGVDGEDPFSTKVTANINFTVGDSKARCEPFGYQKQGNSLTGKVLAGHI